MSIAFFGKPYERWLPDFKEELTVKKDCNINNALEYNKDNNRNRFKLKHSNYPKDMRELFDYGVVCIDKPSGPSSHQISDYVKKILNVKKAGHGGTLDPKATGLLPVAINRATLALRALLYTPKEYVCLFRLHKHVEKITLFKQINSMVGSIKQLPPKKSAVKRVTRRRYVYYVEVLDIIGNEVLIKIAVQAGTYIRKWVHDLGLKMFGAHMTELRRTKIGMLSEADIVTLQELSDALFFYTKKESNELLNIIKPIEVLIAHLPKIYITDKAVISIKHGASLKVPGVCAYSRFSVGDFVALMNYEHKLIALAKADIDSKKLVNATKGLVATLERVVRANTNNTKDYRKT